MAFEKRDPVEILVKHALDVQACEVPDDVMDKTQGLFQDTLACILAGSTSEGIKPLLDTVRLWGGNKQATVLGFSEQTSVPFAALVNSAMGHARDFDDTHDKALNHGCVTLVPAILAIAEFLSSPANAETHASTGIPFRKISGREFLAALAVGLDVANRMGTAFIAYLHIGWLPTTLWGAFGCVAAGARLLDMDEKQTRDAFGLAYSQAQGNRQALFDGALAKRMQPGFSAYAGVQSLFMARNGITGSHNILQGVFGISELYAGSNIDLECITNGLGTDFETSNISIKPYPSCRCTHAVIDAALEIKKEHAFDIEDIVSGEISLPPASMGQVGKPFRIRKNPTVDAQFSAQYTAALSLIKGKPMLKDFEPDVITASDPVIALASRFKTREFCHDSREMTPVEMKIKLADGRTLEAGVLTALGSPGKPLSQEDALFKFNDCLDNCVKQYTPGQKDALLKMTGNLLELDDISRLFECL